MRYFIYSDNTLARRDGYNVPELYLDGEWKRFYELEAFDFDSESISEDEFERRFAEMQKVA